MWYLVIYFARGLDFSFSLSFKIRGSVRLVRIAELPVTSVSAGTEAQLLYCRRGHRCSTAFFTVDRVTGSGDRRRDVAARLLNECGHVTCTSGLEYPPRGQGRVLQLTVATRSRCTSHQSTPLSGSGN